MSTTPESESKDFELDLDLHFLPAWAQKPPTENKYAKFEGDDETRGRRGPRPERRDRRDAPREGQNRPRGGDRPGGPRPSGPGPGSGSGPGNRHGGPQRPPFRPSRPEPSAPPIELNVTLTPEDKGVESLARQIRLTGRAYPLFDIAFLILKKPDRYTVRLNVIKKPDGQPAQPLFLCDLDETLWLSEQEAVEHVLNKHFATFYQTEKTPADPPKGTYTFVAQCGMSGTILGPPNYHDYQNKIRRLHAERYSRMPFEAYKARIKIVRDEPIVKKWLEDQSWKTEFIGINVPEPVRLGSREQVEKHFRETHLPNVIKSVEFHTLNGATAQALPCRPLQNLIRRSWEEQMRFPLKVVNILSQQFASHGLQFFKVQKTVTHVAVARPRYLDLEVTPVSDGIKRIVDFIRNTPLCSRRKILEALAPGVPLQPAAAPDSAPDANATPPTPEAAAVVSDLHWLIHQGHVIEFANGLIELAKKPIIKPPKPQPPAPVTQGSTDAPPQPAPNPVATTGATADPGAIPQADRVENPAAPDAEIPAAAQPAEVAEPQGQQDQLPPASPEAAQTQEPSKPPAEAPANSEPQP